MTDYVLVHGAWGGGWGYDRLAADLRAAGHRVVVVKLTGLGTRQSEFHPGITLTTHIDDVCRQIAEAGFGHFVLAGHSYGGMIVTGVATRLGARIMALVYLDAFLPEDGQSLWDLTGSWAVSKKLKLRAGVLNLLDTMPPFTNQSRYFQVTWDPTYADPRGRSVYLNLQYRFN